MSECPICQKHRGEGPLGGEVIYEDATVVASHALAETVSGYLGYVFVETKRHARGLADLTDDEAAAVALAVSRLARALESEGAENVYSFVFDHIPHHHVHVVARYPGTPREYSGTRVDEWPEAPRGGPSRSAIYAGGSVRRSDRPANRGLTPGCWIWRPDPVMSHLFDPET